MNPLLRGTTTQAHCSVTGVICIACTTLAVVTFGATDVRAQQAETGLWYDDTGRGAVELVPCGTKLCGRIAWLKETVNAEGQPLMDRYNPNPARRTTPICGLQVIGDVQKMGEGSWDQGWIYDPKTGSSYNVAMTMQSTDQLKITGYKGIKLLSKSFVWTRAPADLPRCNAVGSGSAKAAPGSGESLPWAVR